MPPADLDLTELLSLNKKKDHLPDLYIIGYVHFLRFLFLLKEIYLKCWWWWLTFYEFYALVVCFIVDYLKLFMGFDNTVLENCIEV